MEKFIPYIKAIGRGEKLQRDLTVAEACAAMHLILNGEATPAQIGAFLITQRVKGEHADEIIGFTQAARSHCQQITPKVSGLIDLGVPYDGKSKTLQLAPAIALLTAATGQPVVFHGDRGVPTKCGVGPVELLLALGIDPNLSTDRVERQVEELGIGFLYAPQFAPEWHALLPIRQQFGLRTALNTVEKLLNPANAALSVSGFFHMNYMENISGIGGHVAESVWMIQGPEGSIECPPGRATRVLPATSGPESGQELIIIDSVALGFVNEGEIKAPGDAAYHAAVTRQVLANQPSAARDTAVITTALLLLLNKRVASLLAGVELASETLASGAAQRLLQAWQQAAWLTEK
jgi:anthranilate phosphoribosyltransferase